MPNRFSLRGYQGLVKFLGGFAKYEPRILLYASLMLPLWYLFGSSEPEEAKMLNGGSIEGFQGLIEDPLRLNRGPNEVLYPYNSPITLL